jgi:hypothetical protein
MIQQPLTVQWIVFHNQSSVWIFETKEIQNNYDGNLPLNKIDCLSMGRYTCHAVNLLGVDNRYVDVPVKCEYLFIYKATMCNISGRWITKHI